MRRAGEFRINTRGQEILSGKSDVDETVSGEEQDLEDKILSGEFRWINRTHRTDPEEGTCSIAGSSLEDINSQNSGVDTYSDGNSSSGSKLSELAIHNTGGDSSKGSGQGGISRP